MRYFAVPTEPTAAQLAEVADETEVLGLRDGSWFVAVDTQLVDEYLPQWIQDASTLNIPGEPHRCVQCGALDRG